MKVGYIGVIPAGSNSFSRAEFETNDGTKIEIKNFLSEHLIQQIEQEALAAARKKFEIAAVETNLLTSNVIENDDIPF